jgi:hypothetical protein
MTDPNRRTARLAGLLYVAVAITGAVGIAIVPLTLIVRGDASATADRIRSSEWLFRLGIASELIAATTFIFLALALYRLFKGVDEGRARLMVILVLVSVPISFVNVLNEGAALVLLNGPEFLSVFGRSQLEALALLFIGLHSQGFVVAGIFWGLWLLPLGALVIRSGFAPRAVGFLLILAGLGYLADTSMAWLLPQYRPPVSLAALSFEAVGELSMIGWLLITGARAQPLGDDEL